MRIESVRIRNFRSFADATLEWGDYTCLVGPNGSGKSSILSALNIFFRESASSLADPASLVQEDFHRKNTEDPIEITVTFSGLEAEAEAEFADYCRQGRVVISSVAHFDPVTGRAEVKQYGQRLAMEAFKSYFRARGDKAKVAELRSIYGQLWTDHPGLPDEKTEPAMTAALREYEAAHPESCVLIPSEDQFHGISRGTNKLAKYVQWVYVPAVKDATAEQTEAKNTALAKLLARTVRAKISFAEAITTLRKDTRTKYAGLLEQNQEALKALSASLSSRLAQWAHPGASLELEWKEDPEKSVRIDEPLAHTITAEDGFAGELARFGHGLQRSYLLALLQELAGLDDANAPRLMLACEEPELYQHPPQARHLAEVFRRLAEGNAQVLVSTHGPLFVSGAAFEDVRMVRKDGGRVDSTVSRVSFDQVAQRISEAKGEGPSKPDGVRARLEQALRPYLNEMLFTPRLILVEGPEDVAYITTLLMLRDSWEEYRRLGCHTVPTNGKCSMPEPLAIAGLLEIPTFVVFDGDAQRSFRNDGERQKHTKYNKAILQLCGVDNPDPMPAETLWHERVVMWNSEIESVAENDLGPALWRRFKEQAEAAFGHVGNLDKNSMFIAEVLTRAWEAGHRFPTLERLCQEILNFARSPRRMAAQSAMQSHPLQHPV